MAILEKQYVESGAFKISQATNQVLEAVLGSCVGLVIIDRTAKIGGLYHILLPEHNGGEGPFTDEVYADRGLPKFFQELRKAGCSDENMEAFVAGGALIGQLSRIDMDLDIGGRTVEIVNKVLEDKRIPVIQSETGGFYGTRLQLNLKELECRIEQACFLGEAVPDKARKISETELELAISRIKPIPQIALKIIRTFKSENYDIKDIAAQIRQDQVISAKVLQLCNSAFVNAKKEITSIDQAIVILGAQIVIHLVLASALENFLNSSCTGYSLSKGGVFHHAISAAIVSEHISKATGKSEPDTAYAAGLLHDIGKVPLDQYVGSMKPQFYRQVYANGAKLVEAEQSLLGISHTEAGAMLARLWEFPDALIDVIAFHDSPELAQTDPELTNVVYLANLILSRFDMAHELERIDTKPFQPCMNLLGLDAHSFHDLIRSIPWNALNSPRYF